MSNIQSQISAFLLNSRAKIAQLSAIITEQQRDSDEGYLDNVRLRKELIVFNRTLGNAYLDWSESEIVKAIHYYNVKASLNKVPYVELGNFEPFIIGVNGSSPGGPFATVLELASEAAERIAGDEALQTEIDALELLIQNLDLSAILPVGFLDNVAYKDELHSHTNKSTLDLLTQEHVDLLAQYNAHNINNTRHITSTERTRWDAKVSGNDPRLSDARTPLDHLHAVDDVDGLPTIINDLYLQISEAAATDGEDGITPQLSIGDVLEGADFAASITGEPEDLKLNITFKPGEKGEDFSIDKSGLAAERLDAIYDNADEGYAFFATDESNLYLRVPGLSATEVGGWSEPIPFGHQGWSPIIGVYKSSATRAVLEVLGWVGGTGDEPVIPIPNGLDPETARIFIGANGYTFFETQALNLMPAGSGGGLSAEEVSAIIEDALEFYVQQEEGKGLSENDLTDTLYQLLIKLKDNGNGDKFLADDGVYKKASAGIIDDNNVSLEKSYSSSKITEILNAISQGLFYEGNWDASSGVAPSATPTKGQFWIVDVAGTTDLSGITAWFPGDWALHNGTVWLRLPEFERGLIGDKLVDLTELSAAKPILRYNEVSGKFEAAELPTGGEGASNFSELLGFPRDNTSLDTELDDLYNSITSIIPVKASLAEHQLGDDNVKYATPYGVREAIIDVVGGGLSWDNVNEKILLEDGGTTNAKLADMEANTFKIALVAGSPINGTLSQVKTLLSLPADTVSELAALNSDVLTIGQDIGVIEADIAELFASVGSSKLIDVANTFSVGDVLGIDATGAFAKASTTVEMCLLVVQTGKAITPGQSYNLGLPIGNYFYNETTQELTTTQPTAEGEVVRPAYIQGNGFGVFLYSQGYQMAGELQFDDGATTVDESFEI